MRICSPHCGISPESGSGGEVYERELLKDLAGLGAECAVLLAAGKPHPERVPGLVVHPVWPPKGLRWYVTPFVWPRYIKRRWDAEPFDLLRAHSVRFVGPAALWARRRYRLPVPVVTHHHHLDPSPLNPVLERRVLAASAPTTCGWCTAGSGRSTRRVPATPRWPGAGGWTAGVCC